MSYGKIALIGLAASVGGMYLLKFVPAGLIGEEPNGTQALAIMGATGAAAACLAYAVLK